MFASLLLMILPTPDMFRAVLGLSPVASLSLAYGDWWSDIKTKANRYHRKKLMAHDPAFRANETSSELVRRREIARSQGIGPLDSRYPDIFDVTREP